MKQLEAQITDSQNNEVLTQIKRSPKAALYKRLNADGTFKHFEVFAVRSKEGAEIYPNGTAFDRGILTWAWKRVDEKSAETYYGRVDKTGQEDGLVPTWEVADPVTGERVDDNSTETEATAPQDIPLTSLPLPASNEEMTTAVVTFGPDTEVDGGQSVTPAAPTAEGDIVNPPTEEGTDIVKPPQVEEDKPKVQRSKKTGKTVVTVAKVNKGGEVKWKFPKGEFTQAQFATANGLPERGVVWSKLDKLVSSKVLHKTFKQMGRGRAAAVFTLVGKK